MKYGGLLILFGLAAVPAYAQTSAPVREAQPDAMCDASNLDRARNIFTIRNLTTGDNQQCFIHVVPRGQAVGPGQLSEGNYVIALSGGGGGGGGGIERGPDGRPGGNGVPLRETKNLAPGMYRLTIGSGGLGGFGCEKATPGEPGAPTSIADAYSGALIAGYPRAEYFARNYHNNSYYAPIATAAPEPITLARTDTGASVGAGAPAAPRGVVDLAAHGGLGGKGSGNCSAGQPGENGYISLQPAP